MNFNIPEGYTCVTRASDTQLYAYKSSTRDTFIFNGFEWERTATSSASYPSNPVCVAGRQVPSGVLNALLLGGVAFSICFFGMIYKMFKRVLF